MHKKSFYLFLIFTTLSVLITIEVIYIYKVKSMSEDVLNKKITFVKLSTLPDLAISTEATYIRHRSLSTVFSLYKDDGNLREYFPSSYAISHSNIINREKNE